MDAPAPAECTPDVAPRQTECQPHACESDVCTDVKNATDEKPRPNPIATETRFTKPPIQNVKAPVPKLPRATKNAFDRRELKRAVSPKTSARAPLRSGVVHDYCLTPPRAALESTPALETSVTPGCLTLAAPTVEEPLGLPCSPRDYPLATEQTGRLETKTDETNSSAVADRSRFHTPDTNDPGEPREVDSHGVRTCGALPAPRSDALIQSLDNSQCNAPASAAAFPSSYPSLEFASKPAGSAGVHMLVVSDLPAFPARRSIQAPACSHSQSPARATRASATEHKLSIDPPQQSRRGTQSLESPPATASVSTVPPKVGGPRIWNILAVIGGLLTLAALAYVASDLASWFDPVR
jgi:hypothetical protein